MRSWHIAFLGRREFPADLTEFELAFFFSYSNAEHSAIASRRGELHQLAAAIHIGFVKMTGRMLDSFEMIPRPLLEHLGNTLGIAVPTLASLRALYSRRSTLFEHQQWAAEILGFQSLTDRQERYLATLLREEAQKTVTQGQLLQFTKRWLYEKHILIPGERRLLDLVRAAIPQAEQEMRKAIESAIPERVRARWLAELFHPHRGRQSVLEWLQKDPKKASRTSLAEQVQRVVFLKGLGVHAYPLDEIRLERQRRYAQRMRRRRPARFQDLQEPRRTLELGCFLRMTLLQTADVLISLTDKKALTFRRDTVARVTGENTRRLIALRQRICALQDFARSADHTADELCEAIFSLLADVRPHDLH